MSPLLITSALQYHHTHSRYRLLILDMSIDDNMCKQSQIYKIFHPYDQIYYEVSNFFSELWNKTELF